MNPLCQYPYFINNNEYKKCVDEEKAPKKIGCCLFINWRYYNHWAYDAIKVLSKENREWFIYLLNRLKDIGIEEN